MSESRLEEILELLLAEENEKAEEMLHEYVVSKARAEYEKVLDESEEEVEEEVEEAIDQSNDFEDDILADEEEIEADEIGEAEDDMDMDMGDEEGESEEETDAEEEAEEEDLEDKVSDLEAELEDLRAEFEKLMADEMEEPEHADMEMDSEEGEEMDLESVEYDLDEATNFSNKEARQPLDGKQVEADSTESPLSKKPKATSVSGAGTPVKSKDGGEGNKGEKAKDHTPTDNIKVEPKKA